MKRSRAKRVKTSVPDDDGAVMAAMGLPFSAYLRLQVPKYTTSVVLGQVSLLLSAG